MKVNPEDEGIGGCVGSMCLEEGFMHAQIRPLGDPRERATGDATQCGALKKGIALHRSLVQLGGERKDERRAWLGGRE